MLLEDCTTAMSDAYVTINVRDLQCLKAVQSKSSARILKC